MAVEESAATHTEPEVGSKELADAFMPVAALVGSDVCVLPAAFPGEKLKESGSVGWRGLVVSKRGSGKEVQVGQGFVNLKQLRDQGRDLTSVPVAMQGRKGPAGTLKVSLMALDALKALDAPVAAGGGNPVNVVGFGHVIDEDVF